MVYLSKSILGVNPNSANSSDFAVSKRSVHVQGTHSPFPGNVQLVACTAAVQASRGYPLEVAGFLAGTGWVDRVALNLWVTAEGYTLAGMQQFSQDLQVAWTASGMTLSIARSLEDIQYSLEVTARGGKLAAAPATGRTVTWLP